MSSTAKNILLVSLAEGYGFFGDDQRAALQDAAGRLKVIYCSDLVALEPEYKRIEVITGNRLRSVVEVAPNLKWIQHWGTGVDRILPALKTFKRNVVLTNASSTQTGPICEHIFACLLAYTRCLFMSCSSQPSCLRSTRNVRRMERQELAGKSMVILGMGTIGGAAAKIARAFEMSVIGVRRHRCKQDDLCEQTVALSDLAEVLPQADVLLITLPLTAETRRVIGARELLLLPARSYIINIGRGEVVHEEALIAALSSGHLAGAALDVFETEPLSKESPLWGMENVFITPHVAGRSPHFNQRVFRVLLENARRYNVGHPLLNVVDQALGY